MTTIIHFNAPTFPYFAGGSPFKLAPLTSELFPSFFEHFLTFWHGKMLQAHLVRYCPGPRASHFSKETWFLCLK